MLTAEGRAAPVPLRPQVSISQRSTSAARTSLQLARFALSHSRSHWPSLHVRAWHLAMARLSQLCLRRAADYSHMTSLWQHIMSMRITMTKWRIRHTLFVKRCTHPPLRNCRDNAKLGCHGPAHYKMEWIYTQTKMIDQGSVELALIMKRKERKKERKKKD